MDPISQLLSQLSEAHRMTGQSNGSWRFPFERMTSTNRSLERLMVRHRRGAPSNFSWATLSDEQNSNQSLPYSLMDSTSPLLLSSNGNANSSTAQSNQSKTEHKYLLDKYVVDMIVNNSYRITEILFFPKFQVLSNITGE